MFTVKLILVTAKTILQQLNSWQKEDQGKNKLVEKKLQNQL